MKAKSWCVKARLVGWGNIEGERMRELVSTRVVEKASQRGMRSGVGMRTLCMVVD